MLPLADALLLLPCRPRREFFKGNLLRPSRTASEARSWPLKLLEGTELDATPRASGLKLLLGVGS